MFQNENNNTEKFVTSLMKFFFIFIVLLLVILSVHYTGLLELLVPESTTLSPSDSLGTIPDITTTEATTPVITTTASTPPPTTTETTRQTESTTAATTYPPATIPAGSNTEKYTTTKQTTAETTTAYIPPVNDSYDISDEAMNKLIEVRYLSIDEDSRPGYKLTSLKNIVVHYVANPGSTADQNWRHFENNKPGTSAHFIIGLEGEIIQCIPLDEVAWAIGTKEGNYTSISIECCHPDDTGKFTDATYESLVRLVSWLCNKLNLDRDAVIRHYDYPRPASWGVWHKECPLYYANDNDPDSHKRWEAFKDDLIID